MWLTVGDKNTRFFHMRASRRRKRNRINRLKKPDGQYTVSEQELGEVTTSFYKSLYTSEGKQNMEAVLSFPNVSY